MHIAPLVGGEAAVWWARLTDVRHGHIGLLDAVERRRHAGYRSHADSDRFTLGVVVSRAVIGAHLGLAPKEVPLERICPSCGGPHGRPQVQDRASPAFSVSHSGGLVAIAFMLGPAVRIGIDVEPAGAAVGEIERLVLSPAERAALASLDPQARAAARLRAWVRKEAVLKATSDGFAIRMTDLTVTPLDGPAVGVQWPARHDAGLMSLHDLTWPSPAYAACLAVLGGPRKNLLVRDCDAGPLLADLAANGR